MGGWRWGRCRASEQGSWDVCAHVVVCVGLGAHVCPHMHTCTLCGCMHMCESTCTGMQVCGCGCVHTSMRVTMCTHMHPGTTCVQVCMCVWCVCACAGTFSTPPGPVLAPCSLRTQSAPWLGRRSLRCCPAPSAVQGAPGAATVGAPPTRHWPGSSPRAQARGPGGPCRAAAGSGAGKDPSPDTLL